MKKTYNNSQTQAHMFGFWINNKLNSGVLNKKKKVGNYKIYVKDNVKIKEDDEDGILTRFLYIIKRYYMRFNTPNVIL
jgi:hypothetical protein